MACTKIEKVSMQNSTVSPLVHHDGLGWKVRRGNLKDQQASSYDLASAAISENRWNDASELARYTVYEATEPQELYSTWIPRIRNFTLRHGIASDVVESEEEKLIETLRWEDGSPYDPEFGWQRVTGSIDACVEACNRKDTSAAAKALEESRLHWLASHDRLCDWVQGMIAIAANQIGQQCVGDLWQELMSPMYKSYDKYDVDVTPWAESAEKLLLITAEALRGHLSGPGRAGSIEYVEELDRKGFRFTPCGSGGRNFTDKAERTYPVTDSEYTWAWNTKGVCLYCAHCCALSELNPVEKFGYPARVVEPPYRNETGERTHCTWWVYNDPTLIPDEVYTRTGNTKPEAIGGKATKQRKKAAT